MDFLSDAPTKPRLDSGDDSPNVPKPFVAGSVEALSEDLAQFATGTGVTDAARSAVSFAHDPLTSGGAPAKPDHLDLLSDFHPDAGSPTSDSSPALKPALEPFSSSKPGAEYGSSRDDDLLGDSSPATAPPSAPAPDKVAPAVATGAPDLEPPQLKPVKSAAESFVDVKPTLPPPAASRPKASEMTAEPSSTTGSSRASSCCELSGK